MDKNIQIVPYEQEEIEVSAFSFRNFVKRCTRGWLWFAASVAICLLFASLYILRTRPTYTRSATVLIKESAARRMTTSDIESVLSFSGGGTMSSKVVNEVIVFQSPALMQEVVKRLGLTTEYFSPSLFRDNCIYGVQVPVTVDFVDVPSNVSLSFNLSRTRDSLLKISEFEYALKGAKCKLQPMTCDYGDTLNTAIGGIVIGRNRYFEGEWQKSVIVRHYTLDAATALYCARFSANSGDIKNHADVLTLQMNDWSVQRADDVINTLMNVYNESWVEDKNKMAVSTSDFIEDRLVALEKELGDVDDNISHFKSENLLPDLNAVSNLYLEQTRETSRRGQEINSELNMFRYIKSYLKSNPGTETLIPGISNLNGGVSSQIAEYNKTLLNRNNIRTNSSYDNPLVKDLDAVLTTTRLAIETSIDNEIGALTKQLDAISDIEAANNNRIAQNPGQAKYLLTVGRQQAVKEKLYLYLLQKREENELSQAFSAYNTRLVTPPMGIATPTAPKKMRIILIALFLGLFIPLTVFYIIEVSDNKIQSRHDLKGLTLPYLGEIPFYVHKKSKGLRKLIRKDVEHSEIIVKPGRRNVVNEAFRVVRTNLEFMERGHKCPVIITCSFNPGSGKTFLTMNISAALAIKKHKVLAIDGDLRRASLSEYVDLPKKGISNYLSGEENDVHTLICKVKGFDTLDLLPVGTIPPNPSELVSQPEFKQMIEQLKKEYDYILIDCPPIDIVADTQIIEECSDRTIFIVRAGVLDRKDVPNLQKAYDEKRFKNLCYVFNGVDTEVSYYGHYGNYNVHYGSKKESYYGSK